VKTIFEADKQTHQDFETIELQAIRSWHEAACRAHLTAYDWRLEQIGDAICSVCSTDTSILINRVLGLGSQTPPSPGQLAEIRHLYQRAGLGKFFLHVMPHQFDEEAQQILTQSGFQRYRGWMKFERGADEPPPVSTNLVIREIGPGEAEDFAAIAGPAFDMASASHPVIAALTNDPDWHLFMSFAGLKPAGTGALYVRNGVAYTDWGATHPDFRRRGSQSAVLNARIRAAIDMGCTRIVTMTGEAVPGDPQHSYGNILKQGFREAYLRENWIPSDS